MTKTEEEYKSLNTDQKRIVDKVLAAVCHETEPIHLIVSGQGSINILHQSVSKELNCSGLSVAAAAPIGLAAFNINGN